MSIDKLSLYLSRLVITTYSNPLMGKYTWTPYRFHYHVTLDRSKSYLTIQKRLERYRPAIDYVILYDGSLLVDFSSNYAKLKGASLALTAEQLIKAQRESLQLHNAVLASCHQLREAQPLHVVMPELFI